VSERRRRAGAVVIAAAVAAGLASPGGAPAQQASGLVALVAQTPAVAPNAPFTLQVRVTGAPPEAELEIGVHNRVLSRSQYLASIDGERLRSRLGGVVVSLDETPPDPSGSVTVELATRTAGGDPGAVRLALPGVYPVTVELTDGEGSTLTGFTTHIVRLPPAADPAAPTDPAAEAVRPLRVAVTIPVHAPPALQPDGSIEMDGLARAGIVTVASALQRSPDLPLTLVPTPETVASLAADPASPDASLLEAVRRGSEGRQVIGGTYVAIEPAAWLQAGAPTTLSRELDFGSAALVPHFAGLDGSTLLADPTLDPGTAAWFRDRGVDRLVVPEAALGPLDGDDFPVTLAQRFLIEGVDGVEAAMADEALAGHVGETGDPVLDAHHLLADLAVLQLDEPPAERGVVVELPQAAPLDPGFLAAVVDGLAAIPVLRPVDLGTIFDEVPVAGQAGETDDSGEPLTRPLHPAPVADLGTLPARLAAAEADLNSFNATVGTPNELSDPLNRRLLVAAALPLSPAERSSHLASVRRDIDGELSHVDLPDRQTFTLTARQGLVPLSVRNTAGYPMTVLVQFSGERLEFPENPDGRIQLQLTQEITRIEITVRTLTSGDAPLTLTVSTPDDRRELDRSRFTVRSTAVTGVGLALIGGSLLFLAAWWGRNIHRARRNRRLIPSPRVGEP
jgi:Family of unknown function (DUF6049)